MINKVWRKVLRNMNAKDVFIVIWIWHLANKNNEDGLSGYINNLELNIEAHGLLLRFWNRQWKLLFKDHLSWDVTLLKHFCMLSFFSYSYIKIHFPNLIVAILYLVFSRDWSFCIMDFLVYCISGIFVSLNITI